MEVLQGGNPDPISGETAYLYSLWATDGIAHTADNANALQLAIWKLEGEWSRCTFRFSFKLIIIKRTQ